MKREFVSYLRKDVDNDNVLNILAEMMARCLAYGDRIIIEQAPIFGRKYIMVDFSPTDNSNPECEYDGKHVCCITSVENDDEGNCFSEHVNYFDALNEVARIIREDGFIEMYIETY
mgnify:CR=1 FL=1